LQPDPVMAGLLRVKQRYQFCLDSLRSSHYSHHRGCKPHRNLAESETVQRPDSCCRDSSRRSLVVRIQSPAKGHTTGFKALLIAHVYNDGVGSFHQCQGIRDRQMFESFHNELFDHSAESAARAIVAASPSG